MPLNIKSAETFAWPVVLQDNPLTDELRQAKKLSV